jgi:hypothetical protein
VRECDLRSLRLSRMDYETGLAIIIIYTIGSVHVKVVTFITRFASGLYRKYDNVNLVRKTGFLEI